MSTRSTFLVFLAAALTLLVGVSALLFFAFAAKSRDREIPLSSDYVMYQGVRVSQEWPQRIREAQKQGSYTIAGKEYPRTRYGDETDDWHADEVPCHDCAVRKGQFHVPGCDVEECPKCKGQVLSCDCDFEDSEKR